MDLATLVMVTITGFAPGYHWRAVEAFAIKDMATCRAEVGGLIKLTSSPLDRTRSYMFCVAASPRMLADDSFSMQKSIRPWRDIKLWVTRDMLERYAFLRVEQLHDAIRKPSNVIRLMQRLKKKQPHASIKKQATVVQMTRFRK